MRDFAGFQTEKAGKMSTRAVKDVELLTRYRFGSDKKKFDVYISRLL